MINYLTNLKRNTEGMVELSPGHFILEPRESTEQEALIAQCRAIDTLVKCPDMGRLYCIPNGVPLVPKLRIKMKKMGLTPGIPDLHLPVARSNGYHSLYIELKRMVSGKLTDEEKEWIYYLRSQGNAAFVAYGRYEAWAILAWYLNIYNNIMMDYNPIYLRDEPRPGRILLHRFPINLDFSPLPNKYS